MTCTQKVGDELGGKRGSDRAERFLPNKMMAPGPTPLSSPTLISTQYSNTILTPTLALGTTSRIYKHFFLEL